MPHSLVTRKDHHRDVDVRTDRANHEPMGKNVVICLDGTGNQMRSKGDTNVVRLYAMLQHDDPALQVAYYDPGVGTFSAQGAWTPIAKGLSKFFGLAFGTGLRQNITEAYTFLMRNWEPGDRIFLFGFSRGAWAARALAGMIGELGILRPGSENLVPYAVGVYTRGKRYETQDWAELRGFGKTFSQTVHRSPVVPIEFVGLWDSVKAGGFFGLNLRWPYSSRLRTAKTVRHALSIHEKRRPYRPSLVFPTLTFPYKRRQDFQQVWFAGVHSDVGGTFDPDPVDPVTKRTPLALSTVALNWILDGAIGAGLIVAPYRYNKLQKEIGADPVPGAVHHMGWPWILLTFRRRKIKPGSPIHSSVRERWEADPKFARNVPPDALWVDPDWARRRPH